jgi:hypothetical protein
MLTEFDCFIQLKSLYKAALQLHKLGLVQLKAIRFDMRFYTESEAIAMFDKYGSADILCITNDYIPTDKVSVGGKFGYLSEKRFALKEIKAGKAWIYV